MIVARSILFLAFWLLSSLFSTAWSQEPKPAPAPQQQPPKTEEPPEEDESLTKAKKEYEFNPLQAAKEIKIGLFYMKKGSWRAAAGRFEEASLWDPTSADALFYLGEARERMGNHKAKRTAWEKFLELAPEDKRAPDVKKKLAK